MFFLAWSSWAREQSCFFWTINICHYSSDSRVLQETLWYFLQGSCLCEQLTMSAVVMASSLGNYCTTLCHAVLTWQPTLRSSIQLLITIQVSKNPTFPPPPPVPPSHEALTPEGIRRPGVVPLRGRGTGRRRLVVLGRGELGTSLWAVVHRRPGSARVVHRRRRGHVLHVIPGRVLLVVAGAVVGVGALRVGVARVDARQLGAGDEPLYEGRARVSKRCTCVSLGRWGW